MVWLTDSAAGVVGGLLGSSCCAIQIILNALAPLGILSAGCFGFNTVLGPMRTSMRMLTAGFFTYTWSRNTSNRRQRWVLGIATMIALALTFLPEALLLSNSHYAGFAPAVGGRGTLRVELPVGRVGCEACQREIRNALVKSPGVIDARVHGFGSKAVVELYFNSEWAFNHTDIVSRVMDAGFDMDEHVVQERIGVARWLNARSGAANLHQKTTLTETFSSSTSSSSSTTSDL